MKKYWATFSEAIESESLLVLLLVACIYMSYMQKKNGLELSISIPAFASAKHCNHESQDQVKPFVDLRSPTTSSLSLIFSSER